MLKVADSPVRLPWITLLSGAAVLLFSVLPESIIAVLQYDRTGMLGGEVWRLFTGHLVHWNHQHMLWDLMVFLACGGFLEWLCRKSLIQVLVGSMVFVSLSLLNLQTSLEYYRGLSAVDMALFSAICIHAIRYCRFRRLKVLSVFWGLVLVGCFLKPLVEFATGDALFAGGFGAGIEASPASHLFGVLSAIVMLTATCLWKRLSSCSGSNRNFRNRRISEISTF